MNRASLTIELLAQDGAPPAEFRIFAKGYVETTKGVFKFSDSSAESVMAAAKDWGNDYCIDYGHSMLSFFVVDPAESMKAAGWFTPTVRAGELWATSVQWTEKASGMLKAREVRYVSPAFNFDDDGSITELVNVALTNIPATKNQTPLVASRDGASGTNTSKERKMGKKKLSAHVLYKLGLPPDAGDDQVMAALDGLKDTARSADVSRNRIEADARAKADADAKAKRDREGELDLTTLASKAAGDAATSDKSRADSERQLIELTGAKSYGEALGVVLSLKTDVARIPQLEQELAQLKQQGQGATAEALVEQGIREAKISPAQKEMWLAIGKKNPEMLRGFLSTASPVVPKKTAVAPDGSKARVALTAEQAKAAAKMGITDPKALEKLSEQMAEAQALRAGAA